MRRAKPLPLAILFWACFGLAWGQESSVSLSLGYQWVTVSGSEDTYRSQVDEDDGLVLDQLRLRSTEGGELYDTLFLSAGGLGGAPTGRLQLVASRRGTYNLRFGYNRFRRVSTLLDFANPLLASQVFPGQHTGKGLLDTLDLEVEVFPGKVISPLFAYRYARERSQGTTTIHLGQDEFLLGGRTFARSHDFQAGLALHLGFVEATVLQGWRNQDGEAVFGLFPGAGGGNNSRPVLDRDVRLSSYGRKTSLDTDAHYTTAVVSAKPWRFLRFSGRYVYQDPQSAERLTEQAAGSLVSFKLQRFFQSFQETALAKTTAQNWRGEGKVELALPGGFALTAGYTERHRELSGWSLVQDVYLGAVNFSGERGGDITKLLAARTGIQREEKESTATLASPTFGPVSFWASFATTDQEFLVAPDAREVVLPGNQGGRFNRQVDRWSGGVTFKLGGFSLGVDYRKDEADRLVLRTDVNDLKRLRARAALNWGILELAATGEKLDAENTLPGNGYNASSEDWAAEVRLRPWEYLTLWGSYGSFETDSAILVRRPETFETEASLYREDGTLAEAGLAYRRGEVAGEAGWSKFENQGTRGYDFSRLYARLELPLQQGLGLGFEAARYKYQQTGFSPADYEAKRYLFLLRYQK